MFYADTATNGSAAAATCGLEFFGADHSLFATDAPFDPEGGAMLIGCFQIAAAVVLDQHRLIAADFIENTKSVGRQRASGFHQIDDRIRRIGGCKIRVRTRHHMAQFTPSL